MKITRLLTFILQRKTLKQIHDEFGGSKRDLQRALNNLEKLDLIYVFESCDGEICYSVSTMKYFSKALQKHFYIKPLVDYTSHCPRVELLTRFKTILGKFKANEKFTLNNIKEMQDTLVEWL